MASGAVSAAAQLISKLLVEEVQFLYGVHDKVEGLQVELSWMQVFLHNVDIEKQQDALIRMWVSQIQELAYEAEDIVEKYIHNVSLRDSDKVWKTFIRKLYCTLYNAIPLHEVGSGIDKLTQKFSTLNKRLKSYGVRVEKVNTSLYLARSTGKRRISYSSMVDKDLVRRKEDVTPLVAQLLDEKAESSNVVAIVGMGDLGKTTLAREVCRDEAIVDRFTHLVWIVVSPQPQKRTILEETLRQLGHEGDSLSKKTEDGLGQDVKKCLTRDCLVVLDDVWSKEIKFLKENFADSKAKILLTTRQDVVYRMDREAFVQRPRLLNDHESWRLLCKKAGIKYEDIYSDDNLKMMLRGCNGLPVAIAALGAILATKPKKYEVWKEVLQSIMYDHDRGVNSDDDSDDDRCGGVLELSYKELPLNLKPCFLYLGNFPENLEIPTNTLYQLWEAEGFIQSPAKRNEVKDIFDIAEQYLKELVRRCMVDVGEFYENGAIKTCRTRGVMRSLCLKKSDEERFLEVVTAVDSQISSRQVSTNRRVAIHVRDMDSTETFFNSLQEKRVQLRSLVIDPPPNIEPVPILKFGVWFSKMANAFKLLRVLRLESGIKKLPNEVGSCIHLRYLSFKLDHESEVPDVVWKLSYLQTLDLQHNDRCLRVPNKLWKLKRLAHLYLPKVYITKDKLRFSQPRQIRTLVNIDLKDLDGEDMKDMTNLRMLSFKKTESGSVHVENPSFVFSIITSSLLENPVSKLSIDAKIINQNQQIFSSAGDLRIKTLTIRGMIKPDLENIVFPRSLVSLELCGTRVQGDRIMGIVIHGLKELHLNAIRGRKFVVSSSSFPKLQKLTLELAPNSELSEVEGTLPKQCLFRIRCPRSLEIQISIALQQLQHIRDLIRIEYTDY